MKRPILAQNPFPKKDPLHPYSAKTFLWEVLNSFQSEHKHKAVHLDYGTYNGSMLKLIADTGILEKGIGLDVNKEVVEAAQKNMPSNIELVVIPTNPDLPFPAETFDSISIIGVIEHIYDQHFVLKQLHKILKQDGLFIVAVPGKHFFSFMDMGNFKFVFPRIHRFFYELTHSKQEYIERYIECKNGLIGDIEKEKAWHQHFTHPELATLLKECRFEVIEQDGFGFFYRLIRNTQYFLPNFIGHLLNGLIRLDSKLFHQAEIYVLARKI